ncbi:MAG: hypothetical protein RR139_07700 [Lachnospiraceae bacterium]
MKKIITNLFLTLLIVAPLLPAFHNDAAASSENSISTMAFFENGQEY